MIEIKTEGGNNIVTLNERPQTDKRVTQRVWKPKGRICTHGPFLIDPNLQDVECGSCGEMLNPMYVLGRLAGEETKFHSYQKQYQEDMARLKERERTKCQHCKQITKISRN